MKAMAEGKAYQNLLAQDETIRENLSPEELESCFTLDYYFKNIDHIYKRNNIE